MVAVATHGTDGQAAAASDDNAARPPADEQLLDPHLLMAARRGDSKGLKALLWPQEEAHQAAFIVELDGHHQRPPAPDSAAAPPTVGVTMEGDTLLHVVASAGLHHIIDDDGGQQFLDCADVIVRHKQGQGGAAAVRLALEARNNKGDTPLHCAARAGNARMISHLVDAAAANNGGDEQAKTSFLRMHNYRGETALHQGVRAASTAAIDRLLSLDPELAACCSSPAAAACSSSPFYLAVSSGRMDIARHLLDKTRSSIASSLSYYSGPDGRNVLHAAISRASLLTADLLWQMLKRVESAGAGGLLSQLASQRNEENGSTPLHLAASLGGLPSSLILLPRVRPAHVNIMTWFRYYQIHPLLSSMVLNANVTMAYQPDKRGMYPIHVAAGTGGLSVVESLLERCPECATLQDATGRTLLHVAAEEGRYLVVDYVCRRSQSRRHKSPADAAAAVALSSILNAQDINGDTPLHRAVHAGHLMVVRRLIRNRKVRLDVHNNVGMRPIDVSWTTMPLEAYYAWDPRIMIRRSLLAVAAPYGENNRGDLFRQKCILFGSSTSKQDEKKMSEELTAAAQVLALFSVLITTVTFASAFTLPGGSRSFGDGSGGGVPGTPVLAAGPRRSYVFDAFLLSNALAFGLSLLATSLLLYAGVPAATLENRFWLINGAYGIMWHSGRSLLAAFGLGLFAALLPVARTIAILMAVFITVLAVAILKESESFNTLGSIPMIGIDRSRKPSLQNLVLDIILFVFNDCWSYILIFGLPAIRNWAKLP